MLIIMHANPRTQHFVNNLIFLRIKHERLPMPEFYHVNSGPTRRQNKHFEPCLLYTSDAADE